MKYLLLMTYFLMFQVFAETMVLGQKHSLVKWGRVSENYWTNWERWQLDLADKEKHKDWEEVVRRIDHKERVGRLIGCVGKCLKLRGLGVNHIQSRSSVLEGDEIRTGKDSYLWLFFINGMILRMAPDSALSIHELIIGKAGTFFNLRLSYGTVAIISNSNDEYLESKLRETDPMFSFQVPFSVQPYREEPIWEEGALAKLFRTDEMSLKQAQFLNRQIKKRSPDYKFGQNWVLFSTPSMTFFAENEHFLVSHVQGEESRLRRFKAEELGWKAQGDRKNRFVIGYRGYENIERDRLEDFGWFKMDSRGRELQSYQPTTVDKLNAFFLRRIPTILRGREMYLRKYSNVYQLDFETQRDYIARQYGLRIWDVGDPLNQNNDLGKRVAFVWDFIRRRETSQLLEYAKYRESREPLGEYRPFKVDMGQVRKAALYYFKRGEREGRAKVLEHESINSTNQELWKRFYE